LTTKLSPQRPASPRFLFAGEGSSTALDFLERAMRSYGDSRQTEALLLSARDADPGCLHVYFALYKFYFYRKRFHDAEKAVREGLAVAARQGDFPQSLEELTPLSADWSDWGGAQRFFLFSLKALAFIRLRQGDSEESNRILAKLFELDPRDRVGASVIGDLASGCAD